VAGDAPADGRERARDLGDERQHPLAQLVEQCPRHAHVSLGRASDDRRSQREQIRVRDRLTTPGVSNTEYTAYCTAPREVLRPYVRD
jgi:hypothetical protein